MYISSGRGLCFQMNVIIRCVRGSFLFLFLFLLLLACSSERSVLYEDTPVPITSVWTINDTTSLMQVKKKKKKGVGVPISVGIIIKSHDDTVISETLKWNMLCLYFHARIILVEGLFHF